MDETNESMTQNIMPGSGTSAQEGFGHMYVAN